MLDIVNSLTYNLNCKRSAFGPKRNYQKRRDFDEQKQKLLSVFLAVVMLLSTFTVGFYAIAADGDSEPEEPARDTAVVAVEEAIQSWYDTHRNNLYSSDESLKSAARTAYNDVSSKIKALSDAQKTEMQMGYYAYWLYIVQIDVSRNNNENPNAYPNTGDYIDTAVNHLSQITDVMGALPAAYQEVVDAFEPVAAQDDEGRWLYQYYNATAFGYDDSESAQQLLDEFLDNLDSLDYDQLMFSNYLNPMYFANASIGGYYFNCSNPTRDANGNTLGVLFNWVIAEYQDMNGSGTKPAFNYRNLITRSGNTSDGYTYDWAEGQSASTYIAAFNDYLDQYEIDVIDASNDAFDKILPIYEKFDEYKGVTNAIDLVVPAAQGYWAGTPSVDDVYAAVNAVDSLSEMASWMFNRIGTYVSTVRVGYTINNQYTDASVLTPETGYTRPSSITEKSLYYAYRDINNVLYDLMLEEFEQYVNSLVPGSVTDEQIAEAKDQYVMLPSNYKTQVSSAVLAKYLEIVKPAADSDDFADDIAAFRTADFVRPTNSKVAWTEGGIQSFADKLSGLIGGFVNVEDLLSQNLYTDSIIEAIFDLYATLSHDTSDIGMMDMTLGSVIQMIVSPSGIAGMLEESKYSAAAEKIAAVDATDEEEAEGINALDKLAAIDFTAEDFGFTNGDRDGFIDALLAVLRPITTLLAPDSIVFILNVGVNMFDYADPETGDYKTGVYGYLLPILEQLGLTDLPTTAEYKANYEAVVAEKSKNIAADEFLRPIINSLFKNIVDPVCDDLLNGLVDILPRIAYVIDGDRLGTAVTNAFSEMGVLSGLAGSLDLSTAAINNLIPDSIDVGALIGDGTELVLNIGDIPWSTLANCVTVESVESASNENEYFILRTGETDSCISTVMYFLYDVALADSDTYNAIKTLVRGLVPDNFASLVDSVFGMALDPAQAADDKYTGYGMILDNGLIGGTPTGNEIWRVDAAAGAGGSISPSGTIAVKQDASRTFAVTANDGYTISSLTVNGQAVAAAAGKTAYDYTVNGANVTSNDPANQNTTDVTISVTFADESGEPLPGPDPDEPGTNPGGSGNQGGNNGGSTNNTNGNNANNSTLPLVNNNNPNLPNTGAQEIAGMGLVTVVLAAVAGMIVWFVLKKRIAE